MNAWSNNFNKADLPLALVCNLEWFQSRGFVIVDYMWYANSNLITMRTFRHEIEERLWLDESRPDALSCILKM